MKTDRSRKAGAVPTAEHKNRVQALLETMAERATAIAIALVVIATLRICLTYPVLSPTVDEPEHIACGMELLSGHIDRLGEHPPLTRAMAALGPYLAGLRSGQVTKDYLDSFPAGLPLRSRIGQGVLDLGGNAVRNLSLARMGELPFLWALCAVTFIWTKRAFNPPTAVLAVALLTLEPTVLAHAGLATTDIGLTACLGAAFFSMIVWAQEPTYRNSLFFGICTGMAVLAKFTALVYLPAAGSVALIWYLAALRPSRGTLMELSRNRSAPFALAVGAGAITIWAGYLFSFDRLPAPALFESLNSARSHGTTGHLAFLLGDHSKTGWWYFFPVAIAVKTPLAYLILLATGGLMAWRNWRNPKFALPLALCFGVLLVGMSSNVNIGLRHVLPVYIGFSIVGAAALMSLIERARAASWATWTAGVLFVWLAGAGLLAHPDYVAYFNEFFGDEPERILVDSDLDWGQDSWRLARRLDELGADRVYFMSGSVADFSPASPLAGKRKIMNPAVPYPGWTAVSPTAWKSLQFGVMFRDPNFLPWIEGMKPRERVGSLLLYYVPPQMR